MFEWRKGMLEQYCEWHQGGCLTALWSQLNEDVLGRQDMTLPLNNPSTSRVSSSSTKNSIATMKFAALVYSTSFPRLTCFMKRTPTSTSSTSSFWSSSPHSPPSTNSCSPPLSIRTVHSSTNFNSSPLKMKTIVSPPIPTSFIGWTPTVSRSPRTSLFN